MNQSKSEEKNSEITRSANTRVSGAFLHVVRAVWLALVVPSLVLFVVGLPVYSQQLQRAQVCGAGACLNGGLTVKDLQDLASHGFSVSAYAALLTIFIAIITATWCAVGFLLFLRRSDDWMALLAAFFLVMLGITLNGNALEALTLTSPILGVPFGLVGFLAGVSFSGFFVFFPTGRLVPRWMGLILLLNIIYAFFGNFPSPISPFNANWPGWLTLPIYLVLYGPIIFSQIYRYRRVSTPAQRQQTKGVIFGVTVVVGVFIGLLVISSSNTLLLNEVWTLTLPVASLAIPLSIGFSILRYRLYDIDVLINRTLVYGSLTLILALLYAGLVFGGQALLSSLLNSNDALVIVLSTLIVAVLFQPLRLRIQQIIDRRFYRQKYDAARILQTLSATLNQEVEIEPLCEQIVSVVQETMQPTHISLWLRQSAQERTSHPPLE